MAPQHSINVELIFSRKPINEIDNPNNPSISIDFWSQAIAQYTHTYIYSNSN